MNRIVFDIGGTNIRVAETTEEGIGKISHAHTPITPSEAITVLVELIDDVATDEIDAVVGGIPGAITHEGVIQETPNLPAWNGFSFREALTDKAHVPVHLFNDAQLAGLGEALCGAGEDFETVLYIGLGTGIGISRIEKGSIDTSLSTELGHETLSTDPEQSLESLVGGASLLATYGTHPRELPLAVWEELTPALAQGVYQQIKTVRPDVVVLGGSLMNEPLGFHIDAVEHALQKIAPSALLPEIKKALLGDASGLWGAKFVSLK